MRNFEVRFTFNFYFKFFNLFSDILVTYFKKSDGKGCF